MSEKCELYDRECINCGECDICDLDSSKHCDDCGRCLNLTEDYLTVNVAEFFNDSEKPNKKVKLPAKKK